MREALRKLDRTRVGVGPDGEEGQFLGLLGSGGRQLLAAVARLDDKEAREAVEVATPLVVPHIGAFTAHHDGHVPLSGLVDGVPGEVHP